MVNEECNTNFRVYSKRDRGQINITGGVRRKPFLIIKDAYNCDKREIDGFCENILCETDKQLIDFKKWDPR